MLWIHEVYESQNNAGTRDYCPIYVCYARENDHGGCGYRKCISRPCVKDS